MKYKYIPSKASVLLIAFYFIASFLNLHAQYGRPPWMRPAPPPVIIQAEPRRQQPERQYQQPGRQYRRDDYNYDQPDIKFSVHFDPLVSWFSTDSYDTRSDGIVPGFNFGVTYNKYFSRNYSFSSGVNIIRAGGRLVNRDETRFELRNYYNTVFTVDPGEVIEYKIAYLSVPLGLKLETDDLGYGRFFTDVGFDPQVILGGRADIPSLNIKDGNAGPQLNLFNLAFHVTAGMEYPLSHNNYFEAGLGFQTSLFDVTRDRNSTFSDIISQKFISLRLGISF